MGKILDRIMGKDLQGNNQGIIAKIKARRQQADGNGNGYGMFGGVIQQTIVDIRDTVHDAIEEAAQEDGFLKKGLVSNVIPHIRQTRFIPKPEETPAAPTGNMNIPAPNPPRPLQVPVEDTRPLNKKALQYQVDDIRVLGGQYEININ